MYRRHKTLGIYVPYYLQLIALVPVERAQEPFSRLSAGWKQVLGEGGSPSLCLFPPPLNYFLLVARTEPWAGLASPACRDVMQVFQRGLAKSGRR